MILIYLKSILKCDSFDVIIGIKIPFLRVSVTIEPGRSLLQFITTNCLINVMDGYIGSAIGKKLQSNFLQIQVAKIIDK